MAEPAIVAPRRHTALALRPLARRVLLGGDPRAGPRAARPIRPGSALWSPSAVLARHRQPRPRRALAADPRRARRRHRRRSGGRPELPAGHGARSAGRSAARPRAPLPARTVGRPAPAGRDRPRHGARAGLHPSRRDRVVARRVVAGCGADGAPAAGDRAGPTRAFISHDLSVVRRLCDTPLVLQAGRVVECAPAADLFAAPRSAYTRDLLDAIPLPEPDQAW